MQVHETPSESTPPPLRLMWAEAASLLGALPRLFGTLGQHGPADGLPLMLIPGFLASDHTTLGLQRALGQAGWRVTGWGLGLNRGAEADTVERVVERLEAFAGGRKALLVGWSLGGLFAREVAKARPELVDRVVTMGSPFSGDPRANNVWRLYERVAGHPVDAPPIEAILCEKPPVPTLALWSRRDGIVAPACARGGPGEADRTVELDCTHMGFAVSVGAHPKVVAAIQEFAGR